VLFKKKKAYMYQFCIESFRSLQHKKCIFLIFVLAKKKN